MSSNGKGQRRVFSDEFKRDAFNLVVVEGYSHAPAARVENVNYNTFGSGTTSTLPRRNPVVRTRRPSSCRRKTNASASNCGKPILSTPSWRPIFKRPFVAGFQRPLTPTKEHARQSAEKQRKCPGFGNAAT